MTRVNGVVAAAAVVLGATVCAAQEQPGSTYVMGGVAVPHQQGATDEESQTYVTAPGGTTLGWTFGGGVFLTRTVSVDGEISRTGLMTAREPSRYGMTFNEERRDWFFAGNVRFHLRPGSRADLEPVAGLVVTRHQGWSRTEYLSYTNPQQRATSPRISVGLPRTLGLNAGVDLRLGSRHVAVVPSFRVRWRFAVFGDNANFGWYPGGFPHLTVSPALAMRIDF